MVNAAFHRPKYLLERIFSGGVRVDHDVDDVNKIKWMTVLRPERYKRFTFHFSMPVYQGSWTTHYSD